MKRLISLMLSLGMLFILVIPGQAMEFQESIIATEEHLTPTYEYSAQILYASGVNESGSNIHDAGISYPLRNIPVNISRTESQIYVSTEINERPLFLTLGILGRNNSGNMIYLSSQNVNVGFKVLTAIYFDSFSEAVPIFKDDVPQYNHMLRIYLKDDSKLNDYYFVEIYDFELNIFNSIIDEISICEPDYWYAREFQPVDTIIEKSDNIQDGISLHATEEFQWTITSVFIDPADLTYDETIVVYLAHDIVNIPRGGTEEWLHTIQIVDKRSICREDSSFNNYGTSCLEIKQPNLKVTAPVNTAFFTSKTDGVVYKYPFITPKVDFSFTLWQLGSLSVYLGSGFEEGGTKDLDSTFQAYINSESRGYSRSTDISLDSGCSLRNVNDYFQVLNSVRDYKGTSTSSNTCYANWTFDVYNWMNFNTKSYTKTQSFSCRVN